MSEYLIDSIDLLRCSRTPDIILTSLVQCDNCLQLPIPQFKSIKNLEKTYCKSCYMNNNLKLEDLLSPNKIEINMLKQVIINCSNSICKREFSINSLKEMMEHEKICGRIKVKKCFKVKCETCDHIYMENEYHNCFKQIKNLIESCSQNNFTLIKKLLEEQYLIRSEEKIQTLERKILSLGKNK